MASAARTQIAHYIPCLFYCTELLLLGQNKLPLAKQIDNKQELFIIQKMVEGDTKAFKYFFDEYYADLCNFVNIYLNDRDLAEEIVQDIFVYFWENKNRIHIDHSVKAYLFNASKFRSLREIRDKNTRDKILKEIGENRQGHPADGNEPFFDPDEFRAVLNSAVEGLPLKCKEIFLLSKKENLSNKDIAEKLHISVKTVESQMTIALKKLRHYLKPYRGKIFALFLFYLF